MLMTDQREPRLPQQDRASAPLGRRVVILGIILVPLLCIAVEYGELVAWVGELVSTSLMLLVAFTLCTLLAANHLLKRVGPAWRLSRAEMLYLFAMLTAAGSVAGVGMVQFLVTLLGYIFRHATPANRWELYHQYVPTWLVPNTAILQGFYEGGASFLTASHLGAWAQPLLLWSLFMVAFVSFMLCLSLLLRRQWIERERLSFPIVYFPLELTREESPLWRSRPLWVGLAIPLVLQSLASLNYLFPSVPYLPLKPSAQLSIGQFFGTGLLEPLSRVTLAFYPMALGIAYFAELDVLFGCWLFYWLARAEEVLCIALGFRGPFASPGMAEMPYLNQQSLGAFVALGAVALWLGKGEISAAVRYLLVRRRPSDTALATSAAALGGLLASGVFLLLFARAMGIPLPIITLLFSIYFLVVLGFARIRAQAGLPWLFGPNHPPHIFMVWAVGPANLSPQALTSLSYLQWFDWDYRGTAMAHQMEALKISSAAGLSARSMAKGILLAVVLATVVSPLVLLTIYYHFGADSARVEQYRTQWASMPLGLLTTWGDSSAGLGWGEIAGGLAGAAMVLALSALHSRWLWWPFHPVGYALSCTFTLEWLWCPLFVVWLCKSLVLRYGGIRLYRRGIPFAVGLILGDYLVAILWALLGLALGREMYSIFWSA